MITMMRRLSALFALLTLTTTACSQSMKQPDIKLNPQPKMRYELTLTVQDAPGPFESVSGFLQYEVQNEQDCVPADAISGHHERLSQDPDIEFKRVGDSQTYKGTVYLDLVQDGDYYGLGVCRWKMVGFSAVMKAGEVTFNPYISGDQIAKLQPKTEYFAKKAYGDTSISDRHVPSLATNFVASRIHADFFSTTLTARETFQ